MIAIIDYHCGNTMAFYNVFHNLNIPVRIALKSEDIASASGLILPGVGAFDFVMNSFNNSGFREIVEHRVLEDKIPVLGICAGMQILANSSEEGKLQGLGWIPGKVKLFNDDLIPYKTKKPHMGWNNILPKKNELFKGVNENARYYFVHSYYYELENNEHEIASCNYGINFSAAVSRGNIYGVQFHPEKSHYNGMILLKNFADLCYIQE